MIILLDADETIFDFSTAEKLSISAVLSDLGVVKENIAIYAAEFSAINAECWREIEQGKMTRREIDGQRFRRLFGAYGITADCISAGIAYRKYVATHGILLSGAYEFLTALKAQGHILYMITNGLSMTQRGRIAASGVDRFFTDYFISEEIGYGKPDKEYFDAVMRGIPKFDIHGACVIGDSLTADIKGGNDSKITTIWYNPNRIANTTDIIPAYTAYNYCEILKILQQM